MSSGQVGVRFDAPLNILNSEGVQPNMDNDSKMEEGDGYDATCGEMSKLAVEGTKVMN